LTPPEKQIAAVYPWRNSLSTFAPSLEFYIRSLRFALI